METMVSVLRKKVCLSVIPQLRTAVFLNLCTECGKSRMARFGLTFVLIVYVLLVSGTAIAQKQNITKGGMIHGYIMDTTPAQLPIADVRVQIDNGKGHIFQTTSAETGEFAYRDIPADDYLINIHKSGYQSRIGKPVSVTSGGVHYVPLTMNKKENIFTGFQNLFRSKKPQGGTLQLQVTTQSPQPAPIKNAEVKIWQIGKGSNKTEITGISDANGQYRRDNLPPSIYLVTVGKSGYHTTIAMTVQENQMTTASVKFSFADGTSDTDILPSQKTDTKWIIRGKIFDANFQQTPVSGIKVKIRGIDLEQSMDSLSDADGEYEFVLPSGHYIIFLYKEGYTGTMSFPEVTAESSESSTTVLKEGMFVVYEAVAKGNVLALKHGMSKEQRSFFERYDKDIQVVLFAIIIGGISSLFFLRFLNKRHEKHSQE
ncbi:hypothetical protein C6503_07685 [Candidatus Poribacteria bacterium]|nr:MAG: hypothetical protein C6503_07685 [Candidatus Poribacteria bacterium]